MDSFIPRFFEVSAICALVYWLGYCYRTASLPKTALKTISIGALAAVSFIAGTPIWLSLALTACAFGDYFLSRDGAADFIKGVGAFAVGHLFYILLFLTDPLSDLSLITTNSRVATLSVLTVIALIMMGLLWFYAGKLRQAVLGYIGVIIAMGFAAATLPWQAYYDMVMLGVMFFILSDLILSMQLFLMTKGTRTSKLAPFLVWMLYWVAQTLIAVGFVLRMIQS